MTPGIPTRICVLAGGYGGAKLSHGLALVADELRLELSVIVNTGDDLELHGLAVSPDLDTVMYTLAGLANTETGWGVRDETWSGAEMLSRYGAATWFRLGDRDLATHLVRTERLRAGHRLTAVTAHLAGSLGIQTRLLPMCDEPVRTQIRTGKNDWLDFQDWFVRRGHADPALEVRFSGVEASRPTPEVLDAIASADLIAFAPSNPFVSIGTILAVPGMQQALAAASAPIVAVSPIVGGAALRGPADRMFESLGGEASALSVAGHYAERYPGLIDVLIIDTIDESLAGPIQQSGLDVVTAQTVMRTDADRAALARVLLDVGSGAPSIKRGGR